MCNVYWSIFELIIIVTGRKRCTRNTSNRSKEEIALSEYDKNRLSDNGMWCNIISNIQIITWQPIWKYSQYNNTIHVFYYRKLSTCSNNLCFHTKATNWVEYEKCFQLYHMICVGIKKEIITKFCLFYVWHVTINYYTFL